MNNQFHEYNVILKQCNDLVLVYFISTIYFKFKYIKKTKYLYKLDTQNKNKEITLNNM